MAYATTREKLCRLRYPSLLAGSEKRLISRFGEGSEERRFGVVIDDAGRSDHLGLAGREFEDFLVD